MQIYIKTCNNGGKTENILVKISNTILLSITHIKALVCDKELGHGAERNCIRPVLLQRCRRLTHQKTRCNQSGGHFCQSELKKLHTRNTGRKKRKKFKICFSMAGPAFKYLDPCMKILLKIKKPSTWLLESVSPNCFRTNR